MAQTTAEKVASYLVDFCQKHGDPLTNLHLQKYLYYAQGWYLAIYDKPLFPDRLEAWVHGPAQPGQYGRFKHHRWDPITEDLAPVDLPEKVVNHLKEIHTAYGRFSAWDLERMTHAEAPWLEARGNLPEDEPSKNHISDESMRRYFRGRLKEQEQKGKDQG